MKRRILALLLAVLTLTMLTAAAFAEDAEKQGAYNLTGGLKVVGVESDGGFYKKADTFELDCTKLTGAYSLVLLLDDNSGVPTSGNIQYIDQVTVTDGAAKFTLKPKALKEGTYYIFVSTTNEALKVVATFKYGPRPERVLGDVTGEGIINVSDALLALKIAVGSIESPTDAQNAAADVNLDGNVNVSDALLILKFAVGSITSF